MADPYRMNAYSGSRPRARLGIVDDFTHLIKGECSLCKKLDGSGRTLEGYESQRSDSSAIEVTYLQVQASATSGCTYCSWLASALWHQAYWELVVPNKIVRVRFGTNRSVQIWEKGDGEDDEYNRKLVGLEMFTPRGFSPVWTGLGYRPDVSIDPSSEEALNTIKSWLHTCLTAHGRHCHDAPEPPLPARVIDLGTRTSSNGPRICEINGDCARYIALSHCWGTERHITLTRQRLVMCRIALSVRHLPKTFRDAIFIARALGIRYLWIDSLCILQDDLQDWQRESAKMCEVYANAQLTLVAASSSSDAEGFLGLRKHLPTELATILANPQQGTKVVIRRHGHSGPPEPLYAQA